MEVKESQNFHDEANYTRSENNSQRDWIQRDNSESALHELP